MSELGSDPCSLVPGSLLLTTMLCSPSIEKPTVSLSVKILEIRDLCGED